MYNEKTEGKLSLDANVKRLRLEARIAMDRLLNTALTELHDLHDSAVTNGEILEVELVREDFHRLLRESTARAFPSREVTAGVQDDE